MRNAKKLRYIQAIQRSAEYLETITEEISVLEQVYRENKVFPEEEISFNKLMREIISLLGPLAYRKNIAIHLASPANSLQSRQCKTAIKIIPVLILENALKYSPSHSSVQIDLNKSDDKIMVAITDNRPGIDIDEQLKIFDKSYRTQQARENQSGTGLGLYIAKKLAKSMNCTISLRSKPGEGSTFTCTFLT